MTLTAAPGPGFAPPGAPSPGGAAGYVRRMTRASGTNFFYAFFTLSRPRREAIFALYAFCRAVDNVVDETRDPASAAARLADWRDEVERIYAGAPRHPVGVQLQSVVARFQTPKQCLLHVIDGVAMDLEPRRFETWPELARYCDLVAGAVGRAAVRIFGLDDLRADQYAVALGTALQLTNILRDLGDDARLGRFYLPLEDLRRFAVSERDILSGGAQRETLLRFEAARAREFFEQAHALAIGREQSLCAAEVMSEIYRRLLTKVESRGFPTTGPVVRLSRANKAWIAAATWLRCRARRPRAVV